MQMWGILVVVVMGKRDRCESLLGLLLPQLIYTSIPPFIDQNPKSRFGPFLELRIEDKIYASSYFDEDSNFPSGCSIALNMDFLD
jgi:hypothetical protein